MKRIQVVAVSVLPYLCIVVATLLFFRFLLLGQLFESDDYELHAARTANYYLALKQGQLPPRWAPNLSDGFGYPVFNYTYPLPYLIASVLHSGGLTIQSSIMVAVLGACLLATLSAYHLARQFIPSPWWAVLTACAYVANPYTFLQVYWRGAIGEIFLSSLVPAALLCIAILVKNYKNPLTAILTSTVLGVLGAAAILSHVPSLPAFSILMIVWLCVLVFDESRIRQSVVSVLLYLGYSGVLACMLSGFYLFPAVGEMQFIAYTESGSLKQYLGHLLPASSFIDFSRTLTSSRYFAEVIQLGISTLTITLATAWLVVGTKKKELRRILLALCSIGVTTYFLMTEWSQPLWDHSSILQIIQFPWRLLWVLTALALIATFFILREKNIPVLRFLVLGGITLGIGVSVTTYGFPRSTFGRSDYEWYESVILGSSYDEHRPKNALRSYPLSDPIIYQPASTVSTPGATWTSITRGSSAISELNGTKMNYEINLLSPSIIVHKRLAFPGWQVFVDGTEVQPQLYSPPYKGLLQIRVPAGSHTITVSFTGTTLLRRIGEWSTVCALIWLCCVVGYTLHQLVSNPIHFPLRVRHLK